MVKKFYLEIKHFPFKNGKELILELKKNKIILSPWIEDIFEKKKFKNPKKFLPYKIYKIHLKEDLNVNKQIYLKDIYKKLKAKGYKTVEPHFAIYSRLFIKNLKKGTWIRYATPMNSMIDSDGIPHLPKGGSALGKKFLETYWSYPKAIFHPHNIFFVSR
tara:strand:+ start:8523 stop:9002 length:480 start_codon:yes stop_codon:yes gene_type:complete